MQAIGPPPPPPGYQPSADGLPRAPHSGSGSRLWLVRHAEVAERWHEVAYGSMDVELSEAGERATRQLARAFASQEVSAVLASEWHENAPLTVLQARAAGVPVIASDVPGVREILEPGRHGQLFPVGDVETLADHMGAVIRGEFGRYRPAPLVRWEEHLEAVRRIHAGEVGPVRVPQRAPALAGQGG